MKQVDEYICLNNPGAGNCGFYALAVGLLNLIVSHKRDDVLHNWIKQDPDIENHLRQIVAQINIQGISEELTMNRSLMNPFSESLKKILVTQCERQIHRFQHEKNLHHLSNTLPYLHFGELVEYILKKPFDFFEFNPLFYNEKLCQLARFIAIESRKQVNDYLATIYPEVRTQLLKVKGLRIYDNQLPFLSFHEMVEHMTISKKPDTEIYPLLSQAVIKSLVDGFVKKPMSILPSFFSQIETLQQSMLIHAIKLHAEEFNKAYRIYQEGYRKYAYSAYKSAWFATDYELRCLASVFNVSLSCLTNGHLNHVSPISETVFLNNQGQIHWTTFIFSHQPSLSLEHLPVERPVKLSDSKRMTIGVQQIKLKNLTLMQEVYPALLMPEQVSYETRILDLLEQIESNPDETEKLTHEIDELTGELNRKFMDKASHQFKEFTTTQPVAKHPLITCSKHQSLFKIPDDIQELVVKKPKKMESDISPYWSIPFGLGLGEIIILSAPNLVATISLYLAMSIFQAHIFILLLCSLTMMVSVLYSEQVHQDAFSNASCHVTV